MNITRRSFLQSLVALTGGAALGIHPAVAPVQDIVENAYLLGTVGPTVLDEPVTIANPLAWLELDGDRYALTRWDVQLRRDIQYWETLGLFGWPQAEGVLKGPQSWEANCDLAGVLNPYRYQDEVTMRLFAQYRSDVFTGKVYLVNYDQTIEVDGSTLNHVRLQGVGALTVA